MKTIREQVINFMEHNEQLTKLKGKNWYKMEDSLVEFIEKLTGKKDTTYIKTGLIELQLDITQELDEINFTSKSQVDDSYQNIKTRIEEYFAGDKITIDDLVNLVSILNDTSLRLQDAYFNMLDYINERKTLDK